MVRLTRIYTKTGDKGTTALGDGRRVSKDAPRIEAFGSVDELNAVLGLAILSLADDAAADLLRTIQNDLFDLGADLCVPERPKSGRAKRARPPLRITEDHVRPLEQAIDRFNAALDPLTSFVLPGGTAASAWLHLARTVCRRAERHVVALGRKETLNPQSVIYLNRLSDLLFILSRAANAERAADGSEPLWEPGAHGSSSS